MNFTKIIGWLTFLAGISIIVFSLYSSYNIFTGKKAPPEIFKVEEKIEAKTVKEKIPTSLAEIQKELEKMIAEQLKEMIPAETLPKILNLFVWSILAWVLIFGGAQIASLGIKLIKK